MDRKDSLVALINSGDERSLELFRTQDKATLDALFEELRGPLEDLCLKRFSRHFSDPSLPINDFYADRWSRLGKTFDPRAGDLLPYVRRAFSNHCVSLIRKAQNAQEREQAFASESTGSYSSGQDSFLLDYLEDLTDDERRLIVLRFVEDYSFAEIANELGVSTSSAYRRVHSALRKIERWINKEDD